MGAIWHPEAEKWCPDTVFDRLGLGTPFPRKITFADVDFEIEINDRFLVIEAKRTNQEPNIGQARALDARVRQGRTCLVMYGNPDEERLDALRTWHADRSGRKVAATWEDLWWRCQEWAAWADKQPRARVQTSSFLLRHA